MYNSALSIFIVSVGGITMIVGMSLFSTLFIKLHLHTMKLRCESSKQLITGSQIQPKLNPVPVTTNKIYDWCEWRQSMRSSTNNWNTCCEWAKSELSFSVRTTVFLNNENTVIKPVQAIKDQKCELYKWCNNEFFCEKKQFSQEPTNQQNQQTCAVRNYRTMKNYRTGRSSGQEKENPDSEWSYHSNFLLAILIVETSHKGRMMEFLILCCSMFLSASLRNCIRRNKLVSNRIVLCIFLQYHLCVF